MEFAANQKVHKILEEDDDDDGEEKYHDVKLEDDDASESIEKSAEPKSTASWSWVNSKPGKSNAESTSEYRPLNRNPLYTNAETVGLRELNLLANHYHPTVALFAQNVLHKETIKYTGDILVDFSSARFLDRFSFKNPKKEGDNGKIFSRTSQYQPKGIKSLPVNSTRLTFYKKKYLILLLIC
jgi:hypothetical protein